MQTTVVQTRVDRFTLMALVIGLVAYPVLYSTDFFGRILFRVSPSVLPRLLDESSRHEWWYFALSNIAFHCVPFAFVALALKKNKQDWLSLGVDWSWFGQNRRWLLLVGGLLVIGAFVIPEIHYGEERPTRARVGFFGPVTTVERLFMIVIAATVAVTEEVIFRGFALTRLRLWIRNPWLILPITALSFVFIHGEPRNVAQAANYFIAGIVFGVPFILMNLRRLEIIIVIHFLFNAALVLAP